MPAPSLIYQEHDLVIRSIRDYFTPDIQEVLVDSRDVYRRARDFFQAVMPRYQGRVKLFRDKMPIFANYELEEQIEAIYTHKVELKSGGSIVIDQTEALVAIDVNSGRATREKGIEETAYKTNMEAAQEVARQLRLRDMGGLIVIDFIDMRNIKHIQEIEKALRLAVKRDKARTQVARISQFGLLELSRQRLKPTILEGNYQHCAHCEGTGLVKSTISLALSILRRIRAEVTTETVSAVKAILPMDIAAYLQNNKRREINQLEEDYDLTVQLLGNPAARHNECEIDFVRRAAPLPLPTAAEKSEARRREPITANPKTLPSTPSSRSSRVNRDESRDRKPRPAVVAAEASVPSIAANSDTAPVLAIARGRVFWRLSATTKRFELSHAPSVKTGSSNGSRSRSGNSRSTRRTRTWWRRRNQSAANAEPASKVDTPKPNGQST